MTVKIVQYSRVELRQCGHLTREMDGLDSDYGPISHLPFYRVGFDFKAIGHKHENDW